MLAYLHMPINLWTAGKYKDVVGCALCVSGDRGNDSYVREVPSVNLDDPRRSICSLNMDPRGKDKHFL